MRGYFFESQIFSKTKKQEESILSHFVISSTFTYSPEKFFSAKKYLFSEVQKTSLLFIFSLSSSSDSKFIFGSKFPQVQSEEETQESTHFIQFFEISSLKFVIIFFTFSCKTLFKSEL